MEEKESPSTQAKLITRSKAKTSIDHRKIVNYLEKISKDESGAPVKWKFSKKGVKYAQGISKRITKGPAEIKVKRLKNRAVKMENPASKTEEKTGHSKVMKRKGGRKKKIETTTQTNTKLEEDANDESKDSTLQADNLIISIRRVNSESAQHGTTERIVTIHPVENVSVENVSVENICAPEESSQEASIDKTSQTVPRKKRGRPKSIHKLIQEKVKASKLKLSNSKEGESVQRPSKTREALLNLEKVVAAKRGRPSKKKVVNTDKSSKKDDEENTSREQSVSRFDSDIESIDSNISGSSSRQKSKIRKTYQGIRLGPRKLLRSQDNLMTRRKKVTLSSVAASKMKRKRTLSSDFELLDEVSLKRKIRREELDDFSRESSIDRDDSKHKTSRKDEKSVGSKIQNESDTKKSMHSEKSRPSFTQLATDETHDKDCKNSDTSKTHELGDPSFKVKRRGRPPKNSNILKDESEKKSDEEKTSDEIPSLKRQSSPEKDIPKLSKVKHGLRSPKDPNLKDSSITAITNEERETTVSNTRSVFTFGTLKIIGPGGVKLKGNSPLKQVYESNTFEKKLLTDTGPKQEDTVAQKKSISEKEPKSLENHELDISFPSVQQRINKEIETTDDDSQEIEISSLKREKPEDFKTEKEPGMALKSLTTQTEFDSKLAQTNCSNEDSGGLNQLNDSKELEQEILSTESIVNHEKLLLQTEEISTAPDRNPSVSQKENAKENSEVPEESHLLTAIDVKSTEIDDTSCQQSTVDLQNLEAMEGTFNRDKNLGKQHISDDEDLSKGKSHSKSHSNVIPSFSIPPGETCESAVEHPTENDDKTLASDNAVEEPAISERSSENNMNDVQGSQENEIEDILQKAKSDEIQIEMNTSEETSSKIRDIPENIIHDESETEPRDDPMTLDKNTQSEIEESTPESENSVSAEQSAEYSSELQDVQNETLSISENTCSEDVQMPLENSEIPGYYFRNVENESKCHENEQNVTQTDDNNVLENVTPVKTVNEKPEIDIEKDENSSSSDLSLNNSGNFTSLKDDKSKISEESSPEQGDQSLKRKGHKNISPTQRVFQLRQKASRSPLEIIAMRQSKEEREYLLEQSQKAFRREEKQRRMKTKQQRLDNHYEDGTSANTESKDVIVTDEKTSTGDETATFVDGVTQSNDRTRQRIRELEEQCKPCKVILIDFMRYLNVTEKMDPDVDELSCEKTPEQIDTDSHSLEATAEKEQKEGTPKEENKEPTISEENSEPRKKRRPSARKQAIGYHFNRKLTAEIVRYPEDEQAHQSDFVVPPLRLKIKQNLIYEPKKKLKPGRPAKRKARKSMSPKKKANASMFTPEGQTMHNELMQGKDSSHTTIANSINSEAKDSDMFECIYNQCGFQSDRKNIEKHIYVHLKNTKMTCLRCNKTFKNSSMAYAHSGKEHQNEEVLIEPVEKFDTEQYYRILKSAPSSGTNQIFPQVEQSPEAVIIKVVLPGNRHGKGCYCCSYCDFSSSLQQDILDHINENHRPDIQYTCSICDKQFIGNKDGIADHYKNEHPNDPISYKSMPDFYDARKEVEPNLTLSSHDKGNIFEKFSDMFPRDKLNATERSSKAERSRWVEKTSAEADSTTVEHDDLHKVSNENEKPSKESGASVRRENEIEPSEDGIEALAKEYGQITATEETKEDQTIGDKSEGADIEESNDMGLKIIDVVSLRDQSNIDWAETPSLPQSQPVIGSLPYPQIQNISHQSLSQSNVNIVSALTTPRQFPSSYATNVHPRTVPSSQANTPQRNNQPAPLLRKKTDGKTCTTYKCEKCNVHAPVLATMVEHLRLSHKDIEKLFLCPFCRQYEGATEPDIHKHIKQFHQQAMQQRSPPVALSSAAKQHLRTIQVALGDNHSSTEKVVMEKDIYKCLKCNGHMPSLDFIYSHLEKQHNEFFVNACPECKRFRHKDEQVVFQHIRDVHGKSTENVTLSVAIEENLFTRVQCLTKGKVISSKSQSTVASHIGSNVFRTTADRIQSPPYSVGRTNVPAVTQVRPSLPTSQIVAQQQQTPYPSKSSLRKSRPVHRDSPRLYTSRGDTDNPIQPAMGNVNEPPPLMRGPPPLIRFQQSQFGKSHHSLQNMQSLNADAGVRGTSFAMTDRLQRLHSPTTSRIGSPLPSSSDSSPVVSRPVLKVPNVRPSLSSTPSSQPPPYSVAVNARGPSGNVLDLSRQMSNTGERPINKASHESEDISPDAFQIFNIRPGTPQTEPNINKYNQFQVRPTSAPNPRLLIGMQSSPRMQALNQQLQTVKGSVPQRHYLPRQRFASPNVVVGENNMPFEGRIFKCPYCPQIIPLSIAEVPRHIEQNHPGCSIVFHKR